MTEKIIESRSNPRYKALKASMRTGFGGDVILVEGVKLIREALQAGIIPDCFWSFEPVPFAGDKAVYRIPEKMYRPISPTKSGNAPLAIFPTPGLEVADPERLRRGRFLFLDRVQEPGNAGALVRAATAFGIDGVVWRKPCVFPFHHACIRASAGTVFHIAHYLADDALLDAESIYWIGTCASGGSPLSSFLWPEDLVLVMGNEGHGLSEEMANRLNETVSIPIEPRAESLNVAGAGHILMYTMRR